MFNYEIIIIGKLINYHIMRSKNVKRLDKPYKLTCLISYPG